MRRVHSYIARLARDLRFRRFQNELATLIYESANQNYSRSDDEAMLVANLASCMNGKSCGGVTVAATSLSGTPCKVRFRYRNRPAEKALGNMLFVSIVTEGSKRLFQRVCFVHAQKAKDHAWHVDDEQLFLLKNFPPFSGPPSVFETDEVTCWNRSGVLGAFALWDEPADMIFVSAPLFAELAKARDVLARCDIGNPSLLLHGGVSAHLAQAPINGFFQASDMFQVMITADMLGQTTTSFFRGTGLTDSFLGNVLYAQDVYDFTRAWTQLNLGEYTFAGGERINPELDESVARLVQSAGLANDVDWPSRKMDMEGKVELGIALFVLRVNVEHEG